MDYKSISRPFPGFSSLYRLGSTGSDWPFHATMELQNGDDVRLTRAEMTPRAPVRARRAMGRKKPGDIIWTTWAIPVLVSERVVNLLKNEGFSGWRTYDVEVFGHDGAPISGYHGLSIYGRCGPIDDSKSIELPTIVPAGVSLHRFGLYFDPDTWDGSDLFMPEGNVGWKFVVEDVKRAFEKAKIRNVDFERLDEIDLG